MKKKSLNKKYIEGVYSTLEQRIDQLNTQITLVEKNMIELLDKIKDYSTSENKILCNSALEFIQKLSHYSDILRLEVFKYQRMEVIVRQTDLGVKTGYTPPKTKDILFKRYSRYIYRLEKEMTSRGEIF